MRCKRYDNMVLGSTSRQDLEDGSKVNKRMVDDMIKEKEKTRKDVIKKSNEQYNTVQKGIDDAWKQRNTTAPSDQLQLGTKQRLCHHLKGEDSLPS